MATGTFTIERPEKLNGTLCMTMTIEDWREARAALGTTSWGGGARKLSNIIDDLIKQVETSRFYAKEENVENKEKE